jgi:hypothetical protein
VVLLHLVELYLQLVVELLLTHQHQKLLKLPLVGRSK